MTDIIKGGEGTLQRAALESLATDTGLHPLVPYFTQFIADEVRKEARRSDERSTYLCGRALLCARALVAMSSP